MSRVVIPPGLARAASLGLAAILGAKPKARLGEKHGQAFFPPDQFTAMVYRSLGGK